MLWLAFVATLGVGAGVAALESIRVLATVLVYVGIALFLSLGLDPAITALSRRGVRRGAVVLGLAVSASIAASLSISILIPAVVDQVSSLGTELASLGRDLAQQDWVAWIADRAAGSFNVDALLNEVTSFVGNPENLLSLGNGLLAVSSGIIDAVTGIVIVTVLTIYFILTLPAMKEKAYLLVSQSRRTKVIELTEEITQSVGKYVGGQLLLASCNALTTFVVCAAAGNSAPVIIGIIAFVGALIPVVGPVGGASIAVLTTLPAGSTPAIVVAAILLAYLQLEAYVLTPRVMARAVAVPGSLVIVAALGGAALGGILGALVAVPVAAAGIVIVNRVVIPLQARR